MEHVAPSCVRPMSPLLLQVGTIMYMGLGLAQVICDLCAACKVCTCKVVQCHACYSRCTSLCGVITHVVNVLDKKNNERAALV